jgi:hypothetical protein
MRRERLLTGFGLGGLALGLVAIAAAGFAGELARLFTGYGLLVVLAAVYLLLGLVARRLLARRGHTPSARRLTVSGIRR